MGLLWQELLLYLVVFSSVKLIDLAVVFGLLQTVLQPLPKALSPSGFSSSWRAILLSICSWYRNHFLLWMSLQFSPVSFPNLPLKREDQNCKQHSGHHGFIATWSGLVASSPFLGTKRLPFLSQLSTELTLSQKCPSHGFDPMWHQWAQRKSLFILYVYICLYNSWEMVFVFTCPNIPL